VRGGRQVQVFWGWSDDCPLERAWTPMLIQPPAVGRPSTSNECGVIGSIRRWASVARLRAAEAAVSCRRAACQACSPVRVVGSPDVQLPALSRHAAAGLLLPFMAWGWVTPSEGTEVPPVTRGGASAGREGWAAALSDHRIVGHGDDPIGIGGPGGVESIGAGVWGAVSDPEASTPRADQQPNRFVQGTPLRYHGSVDRTWEVVKWTTSRNS
jgi:hypothetical protein